MHFANKKSWYLTLILVVFLIGIIINISEILVPIERKVLDYKFQTRDKGEQADTNIVFIAIDQNSLSFFDKQKVSWPWPRILYAKVVRFLNAAGAKAIIFDIDLSSIISGSEGNDDEQFIQSINQSRNFCLISILGKETPHYDVSDFDLHSYSINSSFHFCDENYSSIVLPTKDYLSSNAKIGIANLELDDDGIVRKSCLAYRYGNTILPSIPLTVLMLLDSNFNKIAEKISDNKITINWYGAGGPEGTYKYYSIVSVILSQIKDEQNLTPILNKNLFKDKIVFIGGTAPSLLEYKATPISQLGILPAMEIHATTLNNLLYEDYLVTSPKVINYLINLFLIMLIFFFIINVKKVLKGILLVLVSVALIIPISFMLFRVNINLPIVLPITNSILALLSSIILIYVFEGKEKRELKQLFSKYVSPAIVEEILKNSNKLDLQGKEIVATVFFSDIQGFTSISEKLEPKEIVFYLNRYFERVSNVILDYKAMLDKYIGDGIMAIFGAPLLENDHALRACKAALIIKKELNKMEFVDKTSVFKTRIGLNTGKMVIGNIGTKRRMDYTAIGDAVNLASRLEGLNKVFGTTILVAESTMKLCKDEFFFREIDMIAVKGKRNPVRVYELIESLSDITPEMSKFKNNFEEGIYLYKRREWARALEKFRNAQKLRSSDKACNVYIERCQNFLINPPENNWDGVFYAKTK